MSSVEEIALEGVVPFAICLLGISLIANFCDYYRLYFIPEAAVAIVVGLFIGALVFHNIINDLPFANSLEFHSSLFNLVLLPPVIFWSGYQVYRDDFYTELGSILTYAFIGTSLSTALIGVVLWGTGIGGMELYEALAFGALISAVDPVGTLSVFGSVKVDPKVQILVFGESILNDAVSIVLFNTFLTFQDSEFTASSFGVAIANMLLICFGSLGIGVGVGIVSALTTKYGKLNHHFLTEAIVVIYFSVLCYMLAEGAGLSGIISAFSGGMFMGMYTDRNLSQLGRVATHNCLEAMAHIADIFIFFTIGSSAWAHTTTFSGLNAEDEGEFIIDWALACTTFGLCLVGRAINIFPLTFILNRFRVEKVPMNYQIVMFWAGLRGSIGYSLSLDMETPHHGQIVFATIFVVIVTSLLFGCTTYPLLMLLKIDYGIENLGDNNWFSLHNNKRQFLLRLHIDYLRPFFIKKEALEHKLSNNKVNTNTNDNSNNANGNFYQGNDSNTVDGQNVIFNDGESFDAGEDSKFVELVSGLASAVKPRPSTASRVARSSIQMFRKKNTPPPQNLQSNSLDVDVSNIRTATAMTTTATPPIIIHTATDDLGNNSQSIIENRSNDSAVDQQVTLTTLDIGNKNDIEIITENELLETRPDESKDNSEVKEKRNSESDSDGDTKEAMTSQVFLASF